ncbi:PepSY domain-containing protein [Methylicorpusculum oleiharenae]|uniref:PepSY-associated TM helix domain-containing protein n=1 Tax=Methylicorpusculum oleiharenae TaxID=1338687 RepID=UPI0013573214|nr:PepSY-associated TM helix domain-containing protein [Methylicorpusculum oleiharenae]MCD2453701.1 PepSY domain-containing protein [Methylicorpusculum oleiharenae]
MRKIWLRLHRFLGLTAALFLLLAGLTGSIIAYQQELDAWLNPDLFESLEQGPLLATGELMERLQHDWPQYRIVSLPLNREAGKAARITVRAADADQLVDADELFVDPVSGKVLGGRIWGACCFERRHLIPFIYVLHYSLQLPGETGLWVMGSAAIVWLFESLVGFYLTLPKTKPRSMQPSPNGHGLQKNWLQRWAMAWRIKPGASAMRLSFDLHRAGGLWLLVLMLMMSVSAISLNLRDAVFEPVVSLVSEFTPSPFDAREQRSEQPPVEANMAFADILQSAALEAATRDWDKAQASIFYNAGYGIFGVGYGDNQGLGLSYLYFDGATGAYLGDYVPGSGTAADIFEAWQLPLHSGQIIGLPGRVLVSLSGLAVVGLAITGVLIWLSKRKALRVKQRAVSSLSSAD